MKAFTDINQSKKLAEILPLESADMFWYRDAVTKENTPRIMSLSQVPKNKSMYYSPCWSLAALLDVLPDSIYNNTYEFSQLEFTKKSVAYIHGTTDGIKIGALKDNLVDTCVEMIIKLKEQKLL